VYVEAIREGENYVLCDRVPWIMCRVRCVVCACVVCYVWCARRCAVLRTNTSSSSPSSSPLPQVPTTRSTTTYTCGDGVHTCAYMWLALPSVFCACVIAGALVEVLVTSCARLTTAGTRLWAVNFYLRVCWQSLRSVKEKRMEEALGET